MKEKDRKEYVDRYEGRLKEHGYSPETLGWGVHGKQDVRFRIISEPILADPGCSVLDVGCGFGDLGAFLKEHGHAGSYKGIDIVPGLIEEGKNRFPEADISVCALEDVSGEFDYVVASGIFNAKLHDDNLEHIFRSIRHMYGMANKAAISDFMTDQVDFQKEGSWHTDPKDMIRLGQELTRRFMLRSDYMPFEFCVFLFKDQEKTKRNVFKAFEES